MNKELHIVCNEGYRVKPESRNNAIFDYVSWRQEKWERPPDENIPFVTHTGILKLPGLEIRVVQLSNGERVIPGCEMTKLLTAISGKRL